MTADRKGPVLATLATIPYTASGTGTVVRRLIENLGPDDLVLLGRPPNPSLELRTVQVRVPFVQIKGIPRGLRGERFSRMAAVGPAVLQGVLALRRHECSAILATFPDECSLLTGYLLHRLTGLPLLAYFCDLYMEDRAGAGWEARVARWLQPRVFRSAFRVMAVNQGMADYYGERYGIDALTLPTCINQPIPEYEEPPASGTPCRIAYSGNINATRLDSLQALVRSVGSDPAYAIHYYTPHSRQFLERHGLWSDNSVLEFIEDESALVGELARCDVLFLPLTFDLAVHSRDQLATCFGIKSYEYFLARRPVLVHCPEWTFLARFFNERGCGLVVSDPRPEALAAGVHALRTDAALRSRAVREGLNAARAFEGATIGDRLRQEIARAVGG
jgi:hypothetical protein